MMSVGQEQLRSIVDRIERLEEEISGLNEDKSEIYKEAKSNGFDVKALREIIRLRRKDSAELAEHESVVDLYRQALGMCALHGGDDDGMAVAEYSTHAGARTSDSKGDGPVRRMTRARQETFEELEAEGLMPSTDTGRTVYFLHAADAGLIKIGSSDNVHQRVRDLQNSSPIQLRLLGTIAGGLKRELELHSLFKDRRAHGEWFTCEKGFVDVVNDMIRAEAELEADARTELGEELAA